MVATRFLGSALNAAALVDLVTAAALGVFRALALKGSLAQTLGGLVLGMRPHTQTMFLALAPAALGVEILVVVVACFAHKNIVPRLGRQC